MTKKKPGRKAGGRSMTDTPNTNQPLDLDAIEARANSDPDRVEYSADLRLIAEVRKLREALAENSEWLKRAVEDASLRASKNAGVPPELLYAPILWAMQDALEALGDPS
jgi:hypothetical protein